MSAKISGHVADGFAPVADAFAKGFVDNPNMGAALCVMIDGQPVINLWGGVADARTDRAWEADTPSVIFSCTKGIASLLVARLVMEGKLAYDAPMAQYWPEFAPEGKDAISVGDVLAHRGGLSAPRDVLTVRDIVDAEQMAARLAAQEPLWPPGTGYGYHALTHGWLTGELVRRATGQSIGGYLASLVTEPLKLDAWIGLPDRLADRPAHLQVSPLLRALWADEAAKPEPNWPFRAMTLGNALPPTLVTETGGFNTQVIRGAELAGAGGIATAEALATIWSAAVTPTKGIRLLDDAVIVEATRPRSSGAPVFGGEGPYSRWGCGFQLDSEARRYLSDGCFGHDGAGGQVGFADPARRIGFGYVTNYMMGPEDQRATQVLDALRLLV
ncbi:serine hydrolase domain-containing protein [Devosia sp.]|uniref:serine hydrolase domain-containing protein n=1 Tax=Devosia sp. TaxID=1871048 RepID=UPI003A92DD4E